MAKCRPGVRLVRSPETLHRLQTRLIGPENSGRWDCLCAAQLLQVLYLAIYCCYLPLYEKNKRTSLSDHGSGFSPFVLKCLLFIALGILWRLLQITEFPYSAPKHFTVPQYRSPVCFLPKKAFFAGQNFVLSGVLFNMSNFSSAIIFSLDQWQSKPMISQQAKY